MAITLAELVYSELIGLVQRTRVSYPACFNKIRLTENMVDKRESVRLANSPARALDGKEL